MLIEISCSDDGEVWVRLIDNVSAYLSELSESDSPPEFFDTFEQADSEPMYWGRKRMLIKGDIVVPKPKQVVTEYSID